MDLKKKSPLLIAIACGIIAVILLNGYLQKREDEIMKRIELAQSKQKPQIAQAEPVPKKVVVVAKKDIPAQGPVSAADLAMREIPIKYIQPGAVSSLEEAIGQIAAVPIAKGEQVVKTKLNPPGKTARALSQITPEGKRAINVVVKDASSVVGFIQPGDFVDVNALITPPRPIEGLIMEDKVGTESLVQLFQAVEVLAVGGELGSVTEKKKSVRSGRGIITLALSPQDAALLSFVQEKGKIKIALRSADDRNAESVCPADWDALYRHLAGRKLSAPKAEEPESVSVVEIYRGTKKDFIPISQGEE